jgi:geranylgeranyl pyrophosphate synthase
MYESFQDYVKSVKPALDAAFLAHLTDLLGDAWPLRSPEGINLLNGGKKIRGSLLCLVTAALGGDMEEAVPSAVAVELIQTATLIHDDFVDQHRTRRNLPSTWTIEGGRRAVLLGDIIFASAIHMMSEIGREEGLIVSRAIADVSRGAYREPLNPLMLVQVIEAEGAAPALYEKIISLKTGVLFGAACRLGAVAAGADADTRKVWSSYGRKIGEAFQIADDLQDVERCLESRSVSLADVTGLAPALLFFVGESRPCVLKALNNESTETGEEILLHFRAAEEVMKAEIERRLLSALDGIDRDIPRNGIYRLACRTPWDLIRMFDEAGCRVSSP